MTMTNLSFETASLTELTEYENNPRHHDRNQVERLAASIREFGFTNPVLVDEDNCLIAGHGRLAAARVVGLTKVPIVRVIGLSAAQARALRIADNRLAERSAWSPKLLSLELEALIEMDFDMELTGFDTIELDGLVSDDGEQAEEEAPCPAPPSTPVSRTGDLWLCGEHRIICGDARDREAYVSLTDGKLADLVITDVPYNVAIRGNVSGSGRHQEFAMASGEMTIERFMEFHQQTLGNARDASRDGSLHYVFIDWRSVADLIRLGRELFTELKNVIAWVKPNGGMGSFYRSQHELIAIFKHGTAAHVNNIQLGRLGRHRTNVWQYPGASGFSKTRGKDLADHPTVKPIKLVADAIRDASASGDLILDPFGGAGTTMLAAHRVKRRAALIEIDPAYVDVSLRRFHEATGIEPVLAETGAFLSDVREQRLTAETAHV